MNTPLNIEIHPLTPDRWHDLERLFGERGAVGGCWCMWWRLSGMEFDANTGENNKAAFKKIVDENREPGLLAYLDGQPVGWVSVAPREEYAARFNNRSPVFKPIDDQPVWSILCFFIHHDYRHQGIAQRLLEAAAQYAAEHGAAMLEAIPVDTQLETAKDNAIYVGTEAMFRAAGFEVVARRRPNRPFMRKKLR
jgi:ribosomal protein S18 acetylase RimI-like enzyme